MKKIILIEPKSREDHVYKHVRMPRLGLPLLGAGLKAAGYDVALYVGYGSALPWPKILEADLVGISTTTSTSREAYRMAAHLKSNRTPVVIGGIHATFMPDEALKYGDYVVRGEADTVFIDLVRTLGEGALPHNIPGVSFWDGDNAVHNPCRQQPVNMDDLPMPDFSLFAHRVPFRAVPVMTSRGCPYDCTFCCVTGMFGRRYRFRSTEKVLQELERYRGRWVFFCDDNFTADLRRSKALLQEMLDRKINLKGWGAQVRVEAVQDEELMRLMRISGCEIVYVGLESINPATLAAYNKRQSVSDIRELIERCHDQRIRVHGMFVFGSDADTVQTIRETVDFALQTRIDSVQFLTLTPLPGSQLFNQLEAEGRILTRDWQLYDGHHTVYRPALISPEQLQWETLSAFKRFYSLKNTFQNTLLTGWTSALYRGIGWWLVRSFEKHNRWYDQALGKLQENSPRLVSLLYKQANTFKKRENRQPDTADADSLLKIYISESKGVIHLRLKGFLDRFALKELRQTIRRLVPGSSYHVVVNAEELSFASEQSTRSFIHFLERLSERVRRLQLVAREGCGISRGRRKERLRLPRFELLLNRR